MEQDGTSHAVIHYPLEPCILGSVFTFRKREQSVIVKLLEALVQFFLRFCFHDDIIDIIHGQLGYSPL